MQAIDEQHEVVVQQKDAQLEQLQVYNISKCPTIDTVQCIKIGYTALVLFYPSPKLQLIAWCHIPQIRAKSA